MSITQSRSVRREAKTAPSARGDPRRTLIEIAPGGPGWSASVVWSSAIGDHGCAAIERELGQRIQRDSDRGPAYIKEGLLGDDKKVAMLCGEEVVERRSRPSA